MSFSGTESGTGTVGTVFQEPRPEPEPSHPLTLQWKAQKTLFPKELLELKTETARTVPSANRNRTEPGPPWKMLKHPVFPFLDFSRKGKEKENHQKSKDF